VLIDVPQSAAPAVSAGQTVRVEIREFPGRPDESELRAALAQAQAAAR